MKIRLLGALVGLAIGLALPTFAQQKEPTPSDKELAVSATLIKQTDDAWNNNDAAALAAMYTKDAVIITNTGPVYGREAIEKMYSDLFKQVHFSNHVAKDDQVSPHAIGNEFWCNGEWSLTYQVKGSDPVQQKGYYSAIDSREGDTWKLRTVTWNITPEPAK
jgi:ketosteroid isomerase-like protein